jgi:hypothetical protein
VIPKCFSKGAFSTAESDKAHLKSMLAKRQDANRPSDYFLKKYAQPHGTLHSVHHQPNRLTKAKPSRFSDKTTTFFNKQRPGHRPYTRTLRPENLLTDCF